MKPQKKEKIKCEKRASKANSESLAGIDGSTATEFLNDAQWTNAFFPMMYHALYISQEPFLDWTLESPTFLTAIQKVFDLSFSNVDSTLVSNDPLVNMYVSLSICHDDN